MHLHCLPELPSEIHPQLLAASDLFDDIPFTGCLLFLARFPIHLPVFPGSLPKKLYALKSLSQDLRLRKPKQIMSNLKVCVRWGTMMMLSTKTENRRRGEAGGL